MKEYNKLVRDDVIDGIEAKGEAVEWHVADGPEYRRKLRDKLEEEVREYLAAPDGGLAERELVDVLEVVHALAALHGHTFGSFNAMREHKANKLGAFYKRIILEGRNKEVFFVST